MKKLILVILLCLLCYRGWGEDWDKIENENRKEHLKIGAMVGWLPSMTKIEDIKWDGIFRGDYRISYSDKHFPKEGKVNYCKVQGVYSKEYKMVHGIREYEYIGDYKGYVKKGTLLSVFYPTTKYEYPQSNKLIPAEAFYPIKRLGEDSQNFEAGQHTHWVLLGKKCAVCANYERFKSLEQRIDKIDKMHEKVGGDYSHWVIMDFYLLKQIDEWESRIEKLEKQ